MSLTHCEGDKDSVKDDAITLPPFPDSVLSYDHYKGVILDLEELSSENFRQDLANALIFWKAEGRKGIWIHVPTSKADWIPVSSSLCCVQMRCLTFLDSSFVIL